MLPRCAAYVGPDPSWNGEGLPAASATTASAPANASTAPAEAVFKTWVGQFNTKDWAGQYETLVSVQKAVVSKDAYVACRSKTVTPTFT